MHHLLFSHKKHLDLAALTDDAKQLGLDMHRFNGEMADRIYLQRVQEHRRAGEQVGPLASPSFFMNGDLVDLSFGLARPENAIRSALGEA